MLLLVFSANFRICCTSMTWLRCGKILSKRNKYFFVKTAKSWDCSCWEFRNFSLLCISFWELY
ncbi:hypothetical protein RND81_01G019900 [Saponaria officinalis]|uniref:Uncharacterized protein n=1 Tax=Saponaria officinalis TaxID=3572 RepID=A0AAW1N576_SAPOF